ncbi:hypothetical protein CA13_08440 [Planctomycetes bacterium CA13]|uniref:Uncharacterized protein n=1 Tax=Novipirellula herctigrandis TaxID=2527986 RepID=A0A5C5YY79_9BACT|nr:hypothetical protein CA13_08440 [Planctomycetes bacterium CA13]
MSDREPAWLVVLIDTELLRWSAVGIDSRGQAFPLIQSEAGNLDEYKELAADDQVSFLRHRLSGVLQRGFDRFYARGKKASHILLISDGPFPNSAEGVTKQLAEHFVEWMINPPVAFLMTPSAFNVGHEAKFDVIAGDFLRSNLVTLSRAIDGIVSQLGQPECWELIPNAKKHPG